MRHWLVKLLAGPELRRLGEAYERQRERAQVARLEMRRRVGLANQRCDQAERRVAYLKEQQVQVRALQIEVERLRTLNGETYREYCEAVRQRDECVEKFNRSERIA